VGKGRSSNHSWRSKAGSNNLGAFRHPLRFEGREVSGGKLVAGYTDSRNPYVNAIANDAGLVIKGREFLGLWVYELGNALSSITNLMPEMPADAQDRYLITKPEAGAAFEDCVFGGKLESNGSVSPPK